MSALFMLLASLAATTAESAAMLQRKAALSELERRMNSAAKRLDFEQAARLRDALFKLQKQPLPK